MDKLFQQTFTQASSNINRTTTHACIPSLNKHDNGPAPRQTGTEETVGHWVLQPE